MSRIPLTTDQLSSLRNLGSRGDHVAAALVSLIDLTSEDIADLESVVLWGDPVTGNDTFNGSQTYPIQTFVALMDKKPAIYHKGLRFRLNTTDDASVQDTTKKTYTLPDQALQFAFPAAEGKESETILIQGGFTNELGDATATAGSATSLTTDKTLTLDQYAGAVLQIVSGAGAGQKRIIRGVSVGPNSIITPEVDFFVVPDATSVYRISYPNVEIQFSQNLLFIAPPQNLYMTGIRFKYVGTATNTVEFQVGSMIGSSGGGCLAAFGCEWDLVSSGGKHASIKVRGGGRLETDGVNTYWVGPNNPITADSAFTGCYIHDGFQFGGNVGGEILNGPGLIKTFTSRINIRSGMTFLTNGGTIDGAKIDSAGDCVVGLTGDSSTYTLRMRIRRVTGTAVKIAAFGKGVATGGPTLDFVEFSDITGDMVQVTDNSNATLGDISIAGTNTGWGLKVQNGSKCRVGSASLMSGNTGAIQVDSQAFTLAQAIAAPMSGTLYSNLVQPYLIADPGNAGAISVVSSGVCNLVSAGAETRTLAAPVYVGQRLEVCMDTDGGDIILTVASAFDQTPHTTITFDDAGDHASLVGVKIGGALRWRLVANNGTTLG